MVWLIDSVRFKQYVMSLLVWSWLWLIVSRVVCVLQTGVLCIGDPRSGVGFW